MNFKKTLITGEFIKRYKRFLVDVKIGKNIVTAHCPNTGSMMGLLKKGNRVWLSRANDPKRKLKYTLQIIEDNKSKVGINTHFTNEIVDDALNNLLIKNFKSLNLIRREVKFGKNTRFDFLIESKNKKTFIEVDGERFSIPGDMAKYEKDGQMTLLGRGSVSINSGGEKIFPEEVEMALKAHPNIFDCLVVGVKDARWGQKVVAVIQRRENLDL